jgi:thioredoxin reductase
VEELTGPGEYPVVVVGSGPGGLQASACLREVGIDHVVLSADDAPAGMFQRFPFFQRLITWTKPYAPVPRHTRRHEWFDWNSLLSSDPSLRALVASEVDGTSEFPSRAEMERGLAAFASKAALPIRYGCRWEGTRRLDDGSLELQTSDGGFRCRAAVFAVGMTVPWKPDTPGMAEVPHYVDTREASTYAGKDVVIIGKRNSGFELADGLLPWASRLVLLSPRPARISVLAKTTAAARARYLQPYEDSILGGGVYVIDAAIERIERLSNGGYRVVANGTTRPGDMVFECDEAIAATGFTTPLGDLPSSLGIATFSQGRLPAQTPYWESANAPGVFFAGSVTQGSIGLKKYGIPSSSAAVHGFRYNARVLASHLARSLDGAVAEAPAVDAPIDFLLAEATEAPELWNQQSYLCRVLAVDEGAAGLVDRGFHPLAAFVDGMEDGAPGDAVAVTVETDTTGDIHPAVYVRRDGNVSDHVLDGDPLHDFTTANHRRQLASLLDGLLPT